MLEHDSFASPRYKLYFFAKFKTEFTEKSEIKRRLNNHFKQI